MSEIRRRPPCVFWVLLPFVLLLIASIGMSFEYMPDLGRVISVGIGIAGVLVLLVSYDAARFGWAIRILGAAVFFAYTAYLISEIRAGHKFEVSGSRSSASPRNALLGLIMFGVPGLLLALRSRRKPPRLEGTVPDAQHVSDLRDDF